MTEPTGTYRWWLVLQVILGLLGGAVWFVGAILEEDFVAGAGLGLLVGALILRFGRKSADGPR